VAQDEDKWQAALKKALNLHVLTNRGNFVTSLGTSSISKDCDPWNRLLTGH